MASDGGQSKGGHECGLLLLTRFECSHVNGLVKSAAGTQEVREGLGSLLNFSVIPPPFSSYFLILLPPLSLV